LGTGVGDHDVGDVGTEVIDGKGDGRGLCRGE
jgi:hypothetical protein